MAGFEQSWKAYRRLRNTFLVVFLDGIPVSALVASVSEKLLHTTTPASVILVLWFALFLVHGIRLQLWRCPRWGRMVFCDLVVQQKLSCPTMRTLRPAEVSAVTLSSAGLMVAKTGSKPECTEFGLFRFDGDPTGTALLRVSSA